MNLEISSFVELLCARDWFTDGLVLSKIPTADKLLASPVLMLGRFRDELLFIRSLLSEFVLTIFVKLFNCFTGLDSIVKHVRLMDNATVVKANIGQLLKEMIG